MPKYSYAVSVRARLRKLRRTQRDVADALGYSQSYISMVLSGRCSAPNVRSKIDRLMKRWEEKT